MVKTIVKSSWLQQTFQENYNDAIDVLEESLSSLWRVSDFLWMVGIFGSHNENALAIEPYLYFNWQLVYLLPRHMQIKYNSNWYCMQCAMWINWEWMKQRTKWMKTLKTHEQKIFCIFEAPQQQWQLWYTSYVKIVHIPIVTIRIALWYPSLNGKYGIHTWWSAPVLHNKEQWG